MRKAIVVTSIIATTLMCGAVLYATASEHKLYDSKATVNNTLYLPFSELIKYSPVAEDENYKLHPIYLEKRVTCDYSFRINLGNEKYVNGLLLWADCGGQTVNNLAEYSITRNSENSADWFNFIIVLSTKEITSASIDFDTTYSPNQTGIERHFGIFTVTSTLGDELIADNYHSDSMPSGIRRDINSGSSHDVLYGLNDSEWKFPTVAQDIKTRNYESGTCDVNKAGGNTAVFRLNGALSNAQLDPNTLSFKINSLTINYTCTPAA